MNTHNHNFLSCAKAEIWDLTLCIVVNDEIFQSHTVTSVTHSAQCPNPPSYFHIGSTTQCSSFILNERLFVLA